MISDFNTPLLTALARQADEERLSFHMPGHRAGQSFPHVVREQLLNLDTTELASTDDLHHPSGPALAAMELAATYFGAAQTLFLTNGSSVGIMALIASLVGRRQQLILPRTCHVSVHHVMALLDIEPVWIEMDEVKPWDFGALPAVEPAAVARAIARAPQSKAIFLTSPDYYGTCSDLAAIAKLAQQAGILLLVDEAHGAHFAAAPDVLPPSALQSGADASVQSAHKTLAALTQGAYLHISERLQNKLPSVTDLIRAALRVFMTSSPSFMIGASLDYARADLEAKGHAHVLQLLTHISNLPEQIGDHWHVSGTAKQVNKHLRDPLRLIIRDRTGFWPATSLARLLTEKGIDIEMADLTRLVLIPSLDTPAEDFQRLAAVLNGLAGQKAPNQSPHASLQTDLEDLPLAKRLAELEAAWLSLLVRPAERVLAPGDVLFGSVQTKRIRLADSGGQVAAAPLTPYPPGIPLILPGERIDAARLDLLQRLLENEITVSGVDQGLIRVAFNISTGV